MSAVRHRGIVKRFDDARGFGFIRPDHVGADVFVHQTAIIMDGFRSLALGDAVEYSVEETPRGLSARDVCKVDESQPTVDADADDDAGWR